MTDILKWKAFLTEQLGEENAPTEYRTLAGRTLSIDDGKTEADVEFEADGSFQRIISYKLERKHIAK